MARNALLEMLFLFLIMFGGSDASFGWKLRKLVDAGPKVKKTANGTQDSLSPTSGPKPMDELGKIKTNPPSTRTAQNVDPMGSNNSVSPVSLPVPKTNNGTQVNTTTPARPPPPTKSHVEKSHENEMKNEGQTFSQSITMENCDDLGTKCKDNGSMIACISESVSKKLVVIVQNGGDSTIKAKLIMERDVGDLEVAKHQNKKINISVTSSGSTRLTLNAGKGECMLPIVTPVPERGTFLRYPSYEKILTPVNGAYFLIIAVLVFGGTLACCKLRKKRHDGVPYQELEMALPESAATNVEMTEGWDQDWDDDWDDNVAVKSPGISRAGSISANGLTARSSNRDGWDNVWED